MKGATTRTRYFVHEEGFPGHPDPYGYSGANDPRETDAGWKEVARAEFCDRFKVWPGPAAFVPVT